jgi:hypothetical protein
VRQDPFRAVSATAWNETRSQQDWLEAEGVRFSNGAADPGRHLAAEALAALVEQE